MPDPASLIPAEIAERYVAARISASGGRAAAMPDLPLFLTAPEAAEILRVKVDRLRAWIARGELPAANLGDHSRPRYRIARCDLVLFLERRSIVKPAPAPTRRKQQAPPEPKWRRY